MIIFNRLLAWLFFKFGLNLLTENTSFDIEQYVPEYYGLEHMHEFTVIMF